MTDSTLMQKDPVTFEVVRGGLYAICEEMKSVMMRASFSPLLSLSADLSCAILDHKGDVVAQGNDIPVHLGAMPFSAKGIIEAFPLETWRPGDAVLNNDPYSGGSHLPDMTLLTPVFDDDGVVGFTASRVHWPDVGGSAAGSSSVTDEIVKEGIRVPPVKIIREGTSDEGVWTLLFANVRIPEDRIGDFRAQVACNMRGVQRIEQQIEIEMRMAGCGWMPFETKWASFAQERQRKPRASREHPRPRTRSTSSACGVGRPRRRSPNGARSCAAPSTRSPWPPRPPQMRSTRNPARRQRSRASLRTGGH